VVRCLLLLVGFGWGGVEGGRVWCSAVGDGSGRWGRVSGALAVWAGSGVVSVCCLVLYTLCSLWVSIAAAWFSLSAFSLLPWCRLGVKVEAQ
jgi:hypothetical protein